MFTEFSNRFVEELFPFSRIREAKLFLDVTARENKILKNPGFEQFKKTVIRAIDFAHGQIDQKRFDGSTVLQMQLNVHFLEDGFDVVGIFQLGF
ncbi:MAG: hypothetical protein Hens3KO_13460 [Henriciella sp.]